MGRRHTLALAAVVLGVLGACSLGDNSDGEPGAVVLVGDSLAEEAAVYLPGLLGDVPVVARYFGGTAPCDWTDRGLDATDSSVVVISFSGNSATPCMADGAGGYLQDGALVDKYRADVATLVEQAKTAGATVVLVGQPVITPAAPAAPVTQPLNDMYRELAGTEGTTYVDAGKAVENDDGSFTTQLPCAPDEPQCDPSGFNVVRSDDGIHFCPGTSRPGTCSGYSSGAFRFADAIAAAVDDQR